MFLLNLAKFVETKNNIVFEGDFNFVENLGLDKKGGNVLGDGGVNELCQMQKDFGLVMCLELCLIIRESLLGRVWEKEVKYYVDLIVFMCQSL